MCDLCMQPILGKETAVWQLQCKGWWERRKHFSSYATKAKVVRATNHILERARMKLGVRLMKPDMKRMAFEH